MKKNIISMKTIFTLFAIISFSLLCSAQVISINCYNQNARVLSDTNNLIVNGGFENSTCTPNGAYTSSFCPNSSYYNCSIANWLCTGGGSNTYACIIDTACPWSIVIEGHRAVYFGNRYAKACSTGDTSCLSHVGCEIIGIPNGYPVNTNSGYGADTGLILSQTVNGLISGSLYALEFWVGGEHAFLYEGLFAVDLGFGNIFLRDPPTEPVTGIGTRYVIVFAADSSSQTIKFTNWGHIIIPYCTELVLDDVRLFPDTTSSLPNANFVSTDTAFCGEPGKCITFFDQSVNNPTSWHWLFPGAVPDSSNFQNPSNICYNVIGTYPVTLIVTNAAGTDTLTVSPMITVGGTPAPPTITVVGDTLFSSHASGYQWSFNGNTIGGATDSFYVWHSGGTYSVEITDSNGCNSLSGGVAVAVNELNLEAGVTIFPNPFDDKLTIVTKSTKPLEIIIYDIASRKIMQQKFTTSFSLNTKQLVKGVYLYEVKSPNGVIERGKIVKD